MSFRIAMLSLSVALLCVAGTARGENWPQWRGPSGDSVSREENLPLNWSERSGLAWKVALPEWGDSTPAIWNDTIFVTTQEDDRLWLLRLDARSGNEVWRRQVGTAETPREAEKRSTQKFHKLHNNASPSPVTDGEIVVAHFGNGDLAAYDFAGKALWKHNLQQEYGTYTVWWGHANSPVLVGSAVVSVCMQDSLAGKSGTLAASYLVAHDKRTGNVLWKTPRMTEADAEECDSYTTPLLFTRGGRQELVVMGGNQLDAYDPATGKLLWHLGGLKGGRTITGPTIAHDMIFTTRGMRGELLGVKPGSARSTDGRLDPSAIAWRYAEATPDSCCPVVWGDWLFLVSDAGIAQCFDARTGKHHWKQRIGGNFKASPVAAEGRIYFLNTSGLATVVAASDRYTKLAENQLDDETLASPAISNGRLYIRGRGHLYAIENK